MTENEESVLGRFSARLASDDIDVVRGALDDYLQAQADTRWGAENPYLPLDAELRFAARDVLGLPASGHSHERALTVLWHLANEEDADRIADILDDAPAPAVREMALLAAGTALAAGGEPDRRLLDLIITRALDDSLDADDRIEALRALDDLGSPEVEDVFVGVTESSDLELQVFAAGHLAMPLPLRKHRARLDRIANSWPEEAGWDAEQVRRALAGFHSTHWTDTEPDHPMLRQAHAELMFPTDDDGCLAAFAALLRSQDPVAVGIALDHYKSSNGLRWVLEDEEHADAYLPEVLARAREVLRLPMSPAEVSALDMIGAQYAESGDADLLVDVLARTDSDAVREQALWLAGGVMKAADVADPALVAALRAMIFEPSVGTKETAIRVLAENLGAEADDVLLAALREGGPKVQAYAAYYLVESGGLARHRAVLEEVAEAWGDRAPYRPWGKDPLELIFGTPHSVYWEGHRLTDPDLDRAHRRLKAPTVDASYHAALRTLLDSGDQAAVGIALDHWWSPDGAVRRGGEVAREPEKELVLQRTREALQQPPAPPELSRGHGPDAKHLCALSALYVVAERTPSLLAQVVELADLLVTTPSWLVRDRALDAVEEVFKAADEADPRLVQALGTIACDETLPEIDRIKALDLLGESPGTNAVPTLVQATRCHDTDVQAAAALALMQLDSIEPHRALIADLNANWPADNVPWRVTQVREALNAAKSTD